MPRKTTVPAPTIPAYTLTAEEELLRVINTCLLWEHGDATAYAAVQSQMATLLDAVDTAWLTTTILQTRQRFKLRFTPLVLAREMARSPRHKAAVGKLLPELMDRADDLTKFMTIYWSDKKGQPISSQVRKGLTAAFLKFDTYALARNQGIGDPVSMRDVMFLLRPKPRNADMAKVYKQLADRTLPAPDMWEKALSAGGANKYAEWGRMLAEKKLGTLSTIRNLRNMTDAGVDVKAIREGILGAKADRALPTDFIKAYREAPNYAAELETLMFRCLSNIPMLPGKTIYIVDVSGSMNGTVGRSLQRLDAAAALAMLIRERAENAVLYATAGSDSTRIHATAKISSAVRGFALLNAIPDMRHTLGGGGIFLKQVMSFVKEREQTADRVILLTDEQDCDNSTTGSPEQADAFGKFNYIVNVSHSPGVAYGKFTHISGWSEAVLDFIHAEEALMRKYSSIMPGVSANI